MGAETTTKLNHFLVRHGESTHSSRRVISQKILDFKTHCAHCAGNFVNLHEDKAITKNSSPRTLDCACSCPSKDRQERHYLLHLQTIKIINRKKITPVLTNEQCVKKLHSIANHKGVPKSLKRKDRNENIYLDSL